MPIIIAKPNLQTAHAAAVLALNPNFFYEFKTGALGVNSATMAGAPDAVVTDVSETAGFVDGAGDFNGTTSFLNAPSHSTNNGMTTNGKYIGLEMVINLPTGVANGIIVSKGQDTFTNLGWFLQIEGGKSHMYIFTNGNWLRWKSASVLPTNQWIHLFISSQASSDLTKEKIWINGVAQAKTHESNYTNSGVADSYPLIIGGRYVDGTPPLDATQIMKLDSIVGYNFELSGAQVLTLAQSTGLA